VIVKSSAIGALGTPREFGVVKGYEYGRGQFVTFTPEELKALDVESSKVIDLEKFVPRGDLDPVYFDSSYYLYPDGPVAVEMLRVIVAAMAEAGVVGLDPWRDHSLTIDGIRPENLGSHRTRRWREVDSNSWSR
jgi:hypothetical protein